MMNPSYLVPLATPWDERRGRSPSAKDKTAIPISTALTTLIKTHLGPIATLNPTTHQIQIKRNAKDSPTMTIARYMGRSINGEVVTRISLVTTSALDTIQRTMPTPLTSRIKITETKQGPTITQETIHRRRSISTMVNSTIDKDPTLTAIWSCRQMLTTPTPTQGESESDKARGATGKASTLAIIQARQINLKTSYLKGPWAFASSTVAQYPSLGYVFSTQEVLVRSSMSVLYLPTSNQDWVKTNWSQPPKAHMHRKNTSMHRKLCSRNFARPGISPWYTYVPFRVIIHGTTL